MIVILADREKGIAKVDLTARSWEILNNGSSIRDKLISVNTQLLKGVRSRFIFITPGHITWTILTPLWSSILLFIIWGLSNSRARYLINSNAPNSQAALDALVPHWIDSYVRTMLILWPLFLFAGLVMMAIRLMSGGLRTWPESLTFKSAIGALCRVRISTFSTGNVATIIIGVIIAVVSSLITLLLMHL